MRTHKGLCASALMAFLVTASLAAHADPFTFDYTGIITSSNFASASAGTTITGTYTLNLANADPNASDNGVGAIEPWYRAVIDGVNQDPAAHPADPNYLGTGSVFASTATAGGFSYASPLLPPYGSNSRVMGGGDFYNAFEVDTTSLSALIRGSSLSLSSNTTAPFDPNGSPVLGRGTTGTGSIFVDISSGNGAVIVEKLNYSLESISVPKAPELSAASGVSSLALLCGALAVLRGRKCRTPAGHSARGRL